MSAAEQVAQRYASTHYGHLILVDDPIYDKKEKHYISNLRSDYPFIIKDDKEPQKKALRIIKMGHLGSITIGNNFKIIQEKTSSRSDCIKNIEKYFEVWKKRAEEIVVNASADNFARIPKFANFFEPIDEILVSLWYNHCIDDVELRMERSSERRNKIRLYLQLLEGLKLIRRVNKGYNKGTLYPFLIEECGNDKECFRNSVISALLRERYSTLRDVFKLTIFEPTIHIDSCIYFPEIEVERNIFRNVHSIRKAYKEYYERRISLPKLRLILDQLESVDAITREGQHYSGNKSLLKDMICIKKNSPSVNNELVFRA
jgi:hypothetical protein